MKEKTLLRIALAISIAGIITLFVLAGTMDIGQPAMDQLDEMIDQTVITEGVIIDISVFDDVTFIRIQHDEIVPVTLFGDVPPVTIGDFIQVRGKVSEDDEGAGIIGDEIRII